MERTDRRPFAFSFMISGKAKEQMGRVNELIQELDSPTDHIPLFQYMGRYQINAPDLKNELLRRYMVLQGILEKVGASEN